MDKDFGPYELRDRIGKGGMAWVYLANQKNLDRLVALKILFPHLAEDEKLVARFQLEARSAAQMRHENVCQVYDFGRHGEQFYIAMEYVEGRNLRDWIDQNGTPPLEIALLMLRDVCRGLEHAHKRSIIHRDIKPSNVMFTPEGVIKLMDFGLARRAEDTTGITMVGSMLGTPAYMSPEQARGEKLDRPTTDIFSFGIVCYELLSGMRPFQGDTSSIARAILYAEPRPLDALDPLVPPKVEAMIRRMLEKDATKRVQTVTEVRQAFDEAVASLGIAHDRSLLDEYADRPQEVGGRLRAQRLARHLERAAEAEAGGDAGALLREYRCVAFLDPRNSKAADYVREHGVAWPEEPEAEDLEHTVVMPPEPDTVFLHPSQPGVAPPPEATSIWPSQALPPASPAAPGTAAPGSPPSLPPSAYPTSVPQPSMPGGPPAGRPPASKEPTTDEMPMAVVKPRPAKAAARPAAKGGRPMLPLIGGAVAVAVVAALLILQPWKPKSPEPAPRPLPNRADSLANSARPGPGRTTATLTVVAAPDDAEISLDGGDFIRTPATFTELEAKDHIVRVRRDSFQTARRVVTMTGNRDSTLAVTLRRAKADEPRLRLLTVRTVPADATVVLDGEETVAAPARFRNLSEGEHTIEVRRDGYEARTVSLIARPAAESSLVVTLSANRTAVPLRTVSVKTVPSGAEVTLDGAVTRRAPAKFEGVPAGDHVVRARRTGSPDAEAFFGLTGARDTTLTLTFGEGERPGPTATLVLWSRPPADFYVERELKGKALDSVRVTVPANREQLVSIKEASPWFGLTAQTTVRPKPGEVKYVGRDFTRDGGRIDIASPGHPGAAIRLDGKDTGLATPATLWVKSGSHRVEVVGDGLQAREGEQSVKLKDGQTAALQFTLERK